MSATKKPSNIDAYKALDEAGIHWDRKDANHIIVFTNGYRTREAVNIEQYLMQAGMILLSQDYDKISQKTWNLFKHK